MNFLGVSAKCGTHKHACFLEERARGLLDFQKDLSERCHHLTTTLKNSSPSFWNDDMSQTRGSRVGLCSYRLGVVCLIFANPLKSQ